MSNSGPSSRAASSSPARSSTLPVTNIVAGASFCFAILAICVTAAILSSIQIRQYSSVFGSAHNINGCYASEEKMRGDPVECSGCSYTGSPI